MSTGIFPMERSFSFNPNHSCLLAVVMPEVRILGEALFFVTFYGIGHLFMPFRILSYVFCSFCRCKWTASCLLYATILVLLTLLVNSTMPLLFPARSYCHHMGRSLSANTILQNLPYFDVHAIKIRVFIAWSWLAPVYCQLLLRVKIEV